MNITIRKIGNSEGIIIPKDVLDRMGVKAGDELTLKEEGGQIQLVPQNVDLAEQLKAARMGMEKYRVALRDAIVSTKELVGTHAVYNFKPDERYGTDERSRVLVKLEKGLE